MEWYCVIGGVRYGPMAWEELLRLAREGRLSPTDLVWNSTVGRQWAQAGSVAGLFEAVPPVVVQVRPRGTGGMTPNAELMRRARQSLKGQWGLAVGANLVFGLILSVASNVCSIAQLIIGGPMELGREILFLRISRRADARFGQLFDGFQNFGSALGAYLLMLIFVFLWTLLLIIPGIIAALSYSMTFFIMADDPGVDPLEAIRRSKRLMYGNKWKLFCLYWRFFGWFLLCLLSFGIGFLWLQPYVLVTTAQFYDDLAS